MRHEAAIPALVAGTYPAPAPEIFLTEGQLAGLLMVSKRTVQRWRVEGRGPRFRRHGSSIRYSLRDALAWSEARAVNSTAEKRGTR